MHCMQVMRPTLAAVSCWQPANQAVLNDSVCRRRVRDVTKPRPPRCAILICGCESRRRRLLAPCSACVWALHAVPTVISRRYKLTASRGWRLRTCLENNLPQVEDRGQTVRATILIGLPNTCRWWHLLLICGKLWSWPGHARFQNINVKVSLFK